MFSVNVALEYSNDVPDILFKFVVIDNPTISLTINELKLPLVNVIFEPVRLSVKIPFLYCRSSPDISAKSTINGGPIISFTYNLSNTPLS